MIFAGYLGSFFLAGAYLAITCMTSAMTRNQVVAFILSVVACLFLILAGFNPVTDLMARWASPALIDTVAAFSVVTHFDGFQKGVIDSRDLFYLPVGDRLLAVRHQRRAAQPMKSFMKKHETLLYSAVGLAALFLILVAANYLASLQPVKNRSDRRQRPDALRGHEEAAARAGRAGTLKLYMSRGEAVPVQLRGFAQRVEDMVREFKAIAGGQSHRREIRSRSPTANTRSRRSSTASSRSSCSRASSSTSAWSVSQLDRKQAIPALSPQRERLLEYDLARAIARVGSADRPVLGLMSALPVLGERFNPMTRQSSEPWVLASELKRDFNVKQVPLTAEVDRPRDQGAAGDPSARPARVHRVRARPVRAARRQADRVRRSLRLFRPAAEPDAGHGRRRHQLHAAQAVQGLGRGDESGQGAGRRRVSPPGPGSASRRRC